MRGEHALASGWLSRGRRLLEGQPRGPAHGYLAYLEISGALEEQRLDEATAGAGDLQRLGAELGDETFTALGLLCEGLAEIRRGHLRNGFGLLDEAMLPVVAERVSPDWAGHIYCTIVTTCIDLMDVSRAREWARNTERWVEQFSDAVMFVGVCRAHRVQLLAIEGAWTAAEGEAAQVTADLADMNVAAVAEVEYQLGEMCRIRGVPGRASAHFARAARLGRDPQPGSALLQLSAGETSAAWSAVCEAVAAAVASPSSAARLLRAQVQIGLATGHLQSAEAAAGRADPGDLQDARFRGVGRRGPWRSAPLRWSSGQGGPAAGAGGRQHRTLGATYDAAVADTLLGAPTAHWATMIGSKVRRCRQRGVRPSRRATSGRSGADGAGDTRGPDPAGGRGAHEGRNGVVEPGGSGRPPRQRGHPSSPPREHLREARGRISYGGRGVGARPRARRPGSPLTAGRRRTSSGPCRRRQRAFRSMLATARRS